MATGIAVWLGSAYGIYGELTIATTGMVAPCVYGTSASALSPIIYSLTITAFKPERFEWSTFKKERLAFEVEHSITDRVQSIDTELGDAQSTTERANQLKRWGRIAAFWSLATFFGHWVLWPLPMYGSHYIFSKPVSVSLLNRILIWRID